MRENDKKIAEWLQPERCLYDYEEEFDYAAYDDSVTGEKYCSMELPYYSTSDSDAITLLPALVKRGYNWKLKHMDGEVQCWLTIPHMIAPVFYAIKPTIATAITAAVIELIEKERV